MSGSENVGIIRKHGGQWVLRYWFWETFTFAVTIGHFLFFTWTNCSIIDPSTAKTHLAVCPSTCGVLFSRWTLCLGRFPLLQVGLSSIWIMAPGLIFSHCSVETFSCSSRLTTLNSINTCITWWEKVALMRLKPYAWNTQAGVVLMSVCYYWAQQLIIEHC